MAEMKDGGWLSIWRTWSSTSCGDAVRDPALLISAVVRIDQHLAEGLVQDGWLASEGPHGIPRRLT